MSLSHPLCHCPGTDRPRQPQNRRDSRPEFPGKALEQTLSPSSTASKKNLKEKPQENPEGAPKVTTGTPKNPKGDPKVTTVSPPLRHWEESPSSPLGRVPDHPRQSGHPKIWPRSDFLGANPVFGYL